MSKPAKLSLVMAVIAMLLAAPLLGGHQLSVHGDPYTYIFFLPNIVPLLVLESAGYLPTDHELLAAASSVGFWVITGAAIGWVSVWRTRGDQDAT